MTARKSPIICCILPTCGRRYERKPRCKAGFCSEDCKKEGNRHRAKKHYRLNRTGIAVKKRADYARSKEDGRYDAIMVARRPAQVRATRKWRNKYPEKIKLAEKRGRAAFSLLAEKLNMDRKSLNRLLDERILS